MRLFKLKGFYYGKDLDDEVIKEYFVAKDEMSAFHYVDEHYTYWLEQVGFEPDDPQAFEEPRIKEILTNKGDDHEDWMGEFYDIKYEWEDLGEIEESEIEILKKYKILE